MEKSEIYIDIYLKDPNCTMFVPGYRYPKDEHDMPIPGNHDRIEWDPENLKKLEQFISTIMTQHYQQALVETLEIKAPIVYVNCENKGEHDIMFFIYQAYINQAKTPEKHDIVGQTIGDHSIATESREAWKEYIKTYRPNVEEIIIHYKQLLDILLQANPEEDKKKIILDFESDIALHGISKLMCEENIKYSNLYLDNIQSLSTAEQQRINSLLFARGGLPNDRWIRIKINDGQGLWKTRKTMSNHRVQSIHDYSEVSIYENDLPQEK